jgi:hypothetical protein
VHLNTCDGKTDRKRAKEKTCPAEYPQVVEKAANFVNNKL